mmetsp:Transcript_56798/g.151571  ORF Transcript_56798/g.151571 Transcript_56798/m.151571 type:complete len:393 (-) Transcript_56798:195-1373(-)
MRADWSRRVGSNTSQDILELRVALCQISGESHNEDEEDQVAPIHAASYTPHDKPLVLPLLLIVLLLLHHSPMTIHQHDRLFEFSHRHVHVAGIALVVHGFQSQSVWIHRLNILGHLNAKADPWGLLLLGSQLWLQLNAQHPTSVPVILPFLAAAILARSSPARPVLQRSRLQPGVAHVLGRHVLGNLVRPQRLGQHLVILLGELEVLRIQALVKLVFLFMSRLCSKRVFGEGPGPLHQVLCLDAHGGNLRMAKNIELTDGYMHIWLSRAVAQTQHLALPPMDSLGVGSHRSSGLRGTGPRGYNTIERTLPIERQVPSYQMVQLDAHRVESHGATSFLDQIEAATRTSARGPEPVDTQTAHLAAASAGAPPDSPAAIAAPPTGETQPQHVEEG